MEVYVVGVGKTRSLRSDISSSTDRVDRKSNTKSVAYRILLDILGHRWYVSSNRARADQG